MPISEVYNMDCVGYMKTLPDNFFDLAIADPPYRDSKDNAPQKEMRTNGDIHRFGDKPENVFFDELKRVSKNQIIWGANNFGIPFKGFIAWDKMVRGSDRYSQVEIASISDSLGTVSRYVQVSCAGKNKIHPTQKPVALYNWILDTYGDKIKTVFDPMMGSQSSRIAAYNRGYDYYGCELDGEYFDKGNERFNRECHGVIKRADGTVVEQMCLFDGL